MFNVIGIEMIDYVNKQNRKVQGFKIHCSYPSDNCEGVCVENFYVSADKFNDSITLGCNIEPLYNRYGKVQSIHII